MLGYGFAVLVGLGALTFEMLESLNFWNLAFPPEKWYLAYLGFFLTSIAMLGYFYEFIFTANGKTQKTVSLVMSVVCGIGALLTAGIGFQITAYAASGFNFTRDEIESMALIVQILIGLHILALFAYYGGDAIYLAWKDDDGDGVPNWLDKDSKKNRAHVSTLEVEIEHLKAENAKLRSSSTTPPNPTEPPSQ